MQSTSVQRLVIACGVLLFAWFAVHADKPAPTIKNKVAAKSLSPGIHLWRGESDADETIQVLVQDPATGTVTTSDLVQREGRIYSDRGSSVTARVRQEFYFFRPGLDLGAFGGYRPSARGTSAETFDVGLRYSPIRTFFGTVSPDLAITSNWIGAGVSIYPPKRLVGPDWSHVGLGAWYGYPTRGLDYGGPGWTIGLSFSIK